MLVQLLKNTYQQDLININAIKVVLYINILIIQIIIQLGMIGILNYMKNSLVKINFNYVKKKMKL